MKLLIRAVVVLGVTLTALPRGQSVQACRQPGYWQVAAAFDLAANHLLPASYPQIDPATGVTTIPPAVLKAVGWVESHWEQYGAHGGPLVSYDFGYGIMQITSGMAGAFGDPRGQIDRQTQNQIASNYVFNIAYGARLLAEKWAGAPTMGDGNPTEVENWYYALWAYNGWGWVNNPNNPRFSRQGNPASDPSAFPYQERVLYLVAHPPRDADGNPMWRPVPVTLPERSRIGQNPGPLVLPHPHADPPPPLSAVYIPSALPPLPANGQITIPVSISNTGTTPWFASGPGATSIGYHLTTSTIKTWTGVTPTTQGVLAYGQGLTPLPKDILPGKSVVVDVPVQAAGGAGSYRIVWDLQEGHTWLNTVGVLPRAETMTVLNGPVTPEPTATPSPPPPAESLKFVTDTSVPDGTRLLTGQVFTKGWLVYNNGTKRWAPGWGLHLVGGRAFGHAFIPVPPLFPCHATSVLAVLRAPVRPGRYHGVWQMEDGQGRAFGVKLTLVVDIESGRAPTPTPLPAPTSTPTPLPTATPVG